MATYAMAEFYLQFDSEYTQLKVKDEDHETVSTYYLDTANQSISVAVNGSYYEVNVASDFAEPTHVLDVGAADTVDFDGTRMGGTIYVDIRDVNRLGVEPGNYTIAYGLEEDTFCLKYVSEPFPLKIYFTETDCFTVEPA